MQSIESMHRTDVRKVHSDPWSSVSLNATTSGTLRQSVKYKRGIELRLCVYHNTSVSLTNLLRSLSGLHPSSKDNSSMIMSFTHWSRELWGLWEGYVLVYMIGLRSEPDLEPSKAVLKLSDCKEFNEWLKNKTQLVQIQILEHIGTLWNSLIQKNTRASSSDFDDRWTGQFCVPRSARPDRQNSILQPQQSSAATCQLDRAIWGEENNWRDWHVLLSWGMIDLKGNPNVLRVSGDKCHMFDELCVSLERDRHESATKMSCDMWDLL